MLEADTEDALLADLRRVDTSVPRRSEGRTKEHTEWYAIARMLSTLSATERLNFPLTLTRQERPDFRMTLGSRQIGIEHTEAVPQNEAHRTVLSEAGYGPKVRFISNHRPGEARKPAGRLISELEANNGGDGWAGDSVEREWARAMNHFISRKISKLKAKGFERFDEDWLLIYDNWSLPALERETAVRMLFQSAGAEGTLGEFSSIFVLTGPYLCEVSKKGWAFKDINDLWS